MKSEKALARLSRGSSQHITLTRRMDAFTLAREGIAEKLESLASTEK